MESRSLLALAATCSLLAAAACSLDSGPVDSAALAGPDELPSAAGPPIRPPGTPMMLADGLLGASGSAVSPDGGLYVTQGASGEISRVDLQTGGLTTVASGLPPSLIGLGGVVDVAFIGATMYALVTVVDDPLFPTGDVNGIYRVDGPTDFTVVADIGAYNQAHQPAGFDIILETGVLYAMQTYRGGFLVTDGHLNRVLHVELDGTITELMATINTVPTGLEVHGNTIYVGEAGPTPHLAEDGHVLALDPGSGATSEVAAGAPLLVDVERGRGTTLFGLAQGTWDGVAAGSPALPYTGSLVRVESDGTFSEVVDALNIPTSLEFIGTTAYIVTLPGEVWTVTDVAGAPFGRTR